MIAGVCKYCGCTNERACPGGCSWVDPSLTICTACTSRMTPEELRSCARNEERNFYDHIGLCPLVMPLGIWVEVLNLVKIGLQHPDLPDSTTTKVVGDSFVASIEEALQDYPAIVEVIRRSGSASFEALMAMSAAEEPTEPESPIIIP